MQKRAILAQVSNLKEGISEQAVEKDAWVTLVLEALFKLPEVGEHLVFKGGTSLSKGYNLIGRFSEDIDFAIDRSLLGFPQSNLSGQQIRNLKRASATFMKDKLAPLLREQLLAFGLSNKDFKVSCKETEQSDLDPLPLYVEYRPVSGV
ncbi:MAG: nucleotidyl transferase AbiEii/AbiGii toxin family protein, partial [Chitinophagaceae bacterium]